MELKGIFYNPNFGLWAQGKSYTFYLKEYEAHFTPLMYTKENQFLSALKSGVEVRLGPSNLVEWDE